MPKPIRVLLCAFMLLGAAPACADEALPPLLSPPPAVRAFGWSLEGGASFSGINGAVREGSDPGRGFDFGFGFGLQWTLRWKLLRAGVDGDFAMHVFAPGAAHAGLVAGLTWQPVPAVRLDLLADGGLSTYFDLGTALFVTKVEGERTAFLPYAGARVGIGWRFGPRGQGVVGLYLGLREDLMRRTTHLTVTSCLLGCATTDETWRMGGESFYVLSRIGWEI